MKPHLICSDCDKKAKWLRHTQFAGIHVFCAICAEKQKDFKKTDSGYFWTNKDKDGNEL